MNESKLKVINWDESMLDGVLEAQSVGIAKVNYAASGYFSGTISTVYAMHFFGENDASTYSGFAIFSGEIAGKNGSFVMEEWGTQSTDGLSAKLVVNAGTGSADFKGISGTAQHVHRNDIPVLYFDFIFE